MVPMLATNLFIRPWYTLRVLQIPVWTYLQKALGRGLAVGALFLVLGAFAALVLPARGVPQLALLVLSQGALFGPLAYWIGLIGQERGYVWARAKRLASRRNGEPSDSVRYARA
jgi:hypothetical protein